MAARTAKKMVANCDEYHTEESVRPDMLAVSMARGNCTGWRHEQKQSWQGKGEDKQPGEKRWKERRISRFLSLFAAIQFFLH